MTQSEKIERIKYLVAALSEASKAYYAQDREIMSANPPRYLRW